MRFWGMILMIIMLFSPVAAFSCEFFQCPVLKASRTSTLSGDYIRDLQSLLNSSGYYQGPVSGKYDSMTSRAVRHFQSDHQLKADGVVGPQTWQALADLYEKKPVMAKSKNDGPKGRVSIIIDLDKKQLQILENEKLFKKYPVAVGKSETPSPVGEFRVVHKALNWGTGFGTRWMGLDVPWGIYGIHGTNKPWSIGCAESHGCFRMFNQHVEEIFSWIPIGTHVRIIGWTSKFQGFNRQMKLKSSGQDVVMLQYRLQTMGFCPDYADGYFGRMTELAVKMFEAAHLLPVDGVADMDMLKCLDTYFNEKKK